MLTLYIYRYTFLIKHFYFFHKEHLDTDQENNIDFSTEIEPVWII